MKIKIFSTGGTIDKIYFDQKSQFEVGDPQIVTVLQEARVTFDFELQPIMRKDSLDLTDADRALIRETIANDPNERVLVTHGTDTMVETARSLQEIAGKTIVLTGSLEPARFRVSDAIFNIGCAVGALQVLPHGVYIAMNGRVFTPDRVRKNRDRNIFEEL